MCGGRHGHRHRGFGRARLRYPNRDELLSSLEEHQKDLEQEVADVADLIRRLRDEQQQPPREQPATT